LADEFVFHIRNAQPGDMAAILATLDVCSGLSTIAEIVEQAQQLGFTIRDRMRLEALATARDLGLVEQSGNALSGEGHVLAQLEVIKPDLFADLIHGLHYTLWSEHQPGVHCFSWSYRFFCSILWRAGTMELQDRRGLASEVESRACTVFNRDDIAFSPKSIGGALLWLEELSPPVITEGSRFARRAFCPPELFVIAVDSAYRSQGIDHGANLLLTDERRSDVCQLCLLDPTNLERVLEYAVVQFDYLEQGIGGGWGRYLTLHRAPYMEDFV
jgi:hypothetical protein